MTSFAPIHRLVAVVLSAANAAAPASPPQQPAGPRATTIATFDPLTSHGRLGGVAVGRTGEIFVSNFHGSVWRVNADGSVIALAQDLRGSSGNAVDRDGNLYQASFLDGRIVRITPEGNATDMVSGGLEGPVGIAVDDRGSVFVCECRGNTVARVTPNGRVSEFARHPDLDCPNGITRGPDGALYVVSYNNEHVVRIGTSGEAERFASVPGGNNAHIAYARGAFWITKIGTNLLYRLTPDGLSERYAGTGDIGFADGSLSSATLAHPNGIAVTPGGGAVIVNTLNGPWRGEEETSIVLRRIDLPEDPGDPVPISIQVGDMVFDALSAGTPDGDLVLLLHGFPETGFAFEHQLRALGAAGYHAVAPDQRGYSPGARPRVREEYVMGNFVADVAGIADAMGYEKFHLVGHDWGGAVAWVTATRFPNRVLSLTVLSTPHYGALGSQRSVAESDQAQRSSYFRRFGELGAEHWFLADDMAIFREVLSGLPQERRNFYLSRLGNLEAMRAALAWYHVFAPPSQPPATGAAPATRPVTPVMVPTMYVWGTDDGAFGREAAEKTADFVSGPYDFHVLEGVGHWVPELAADTVTQLLLRHLNGERTTGTEALDNYRNARSVLDRAVDALGGAAAILGFQNLSATYHSSGLARGQSRRPGPPFDSTNARGRFAYEPGGRLFQEEELVNEGGTDRSFRRALLEEGSWNLWIARDLLTRIEPPDIAFLRARPNLNPEKAFPHDLLRSALHNAASLRYLGGDEGRRIARISFTEADGEVTTMGIDTETGFPLLAERLGSDRLVGDVVFGVRFGDYSPVGGISIPRRLAFTINGSPTGTWSLTNVLINETTDSTLFRPPETLDFVDQPPRFRPIPVAPGVYMVRLYSGPANSYNTMIVEFEDYVVVLEAPLVGAFFPVIRQIAAGVAPGKPIRAIVTTHHHHDHAGGAARFLTAGIDVIAPPDAVPVIRAMANAPHTFQPAVPATGGPGRLIAVSDSLVLSDGSRTLRLLQVGPAPHVNQILVAHLPTERVVYVADLFAVPESHIYPPASPTFTHFNQLVDRFDLDFDTVVPTHGVVGTPADLRAAVAR